jgi:hypothetical protein
MKRLILFALVAAAAWYGWQNSDSLRTPAANEAVIVNRSGAVLERVRLTVGGETLVREVIDEEARVSLPFKTRTDAEFRLVWQTRGRMGEMSWSGGRLVGGPTPSKHVFEVLADGGVVWRAEAKSPLPK